MTRYRLQDWLFWVLMLGFAGTETELVLLEHYEDPWQFVPLVLIACSAVVLVQHRRGGLAGRRRTLEVLMVLFIVSSLVGVVLHFRGAAEFQLETDPGIGTWDLMKKVAHAQAPPLLAPGVMLQLGLIGLAYAAADPARTSATQDAKD